MMKNSSKSSSPAVVPREAFRSANTFIAREANHVAIPFASFAQSQTSESGFGLGNTGVPLFVPIFVGASGQNRVGEGIARLIMAEMVKRDGVETAMLNVLDLAAVQPALQRAEAMIIIIPEYNYGYPDMLKSLFEKNPAHNLRRVIGICDLSPGWFGGTRLLETLLPMMRKFGVLPIFWDGDCSQGVESSHSKNDEAKCKGLDNFLNDFLDLATLLHRHQNVFSPN